MLSLRRAIIGTLEVARYTVLSRALITTSLCVRKDDVCDLDNCTYWPGGVKSVWYIIHGVYVEVQVQDSSYDSTGECDKYNAFVSFV